MYRVKTFNEIKDGEIIVTTIGEFPDLYSAYICKNAVENEMYSALGYATTFFRHEVRIMKVVETEQEVSENELSEFKQTKPVYLPFDDPSLNSGF